MVDFLGVGENILSHRISVDKWISVLFFRFADFMSGWGDCQRWFWNWSADSAKFTGSFLREHHHYHSTSLANSDGLWSDSCYEWWKNSWVRYTTKPSASPVFAFCDAAPAERKVDYRSWVTEDLLRIYPVMSANYFIRWFSCLVWISFSFVVLLSALGIPVRLLESALERNQEDSL